MDEKTEQLNRKINDDKCDDKAKDNICNNQKGTENEREGSEQREKNANVRNDEMENIPNDMTSNTQNIPDTDEQAKSGGNR